MKQKKITIIGVPMDLGQNRRGVDMGPSAIRYAGVVEKLEELNCLIDDYGDLPIDMVKRHSGDLSSGLRNLEAIERANTRLAELVDRVIRENSFPLVLGGDHSIAIGTLAGVSRHYDNLGVIWFDAHGDLNTADTSPSGNVHGMPLAASLGFGHDTLTQLGGYGPKIKPENLVIIGPRALDRGEKELIQRHGIHVYTMHEIDRMGMAAVMDESIQYLQSRVDGVHLSLDLDGMDPTDAPGVGTPVIGGISYRESHLAMEMLAESELIVSAEFVEINPILDERNRTAQAAVALISSLLGDRLK